MALSLQDQLLKAGLADKQKANKIKKEKHKKVKAKQKHKVEDVNTAKQSAEQALAEKKAKDQELNQQKQQEIQAKAVVAQIKQLIDLNKQARRGNVACSFTDGTLIKRIYVSAQMQKHIAQGKLAIVRQGEGYEVVPMPVADKIFQRDESLVVYRADELENDSTESTSEEDDWYADYQIPDDLSW